MPDSHTQTSIQTPRRTPTIERSARRSNMDLPSLFTDTPQGYIMMLTLTGRMFMATWNSSLNRTAFSATLHCLTGCAIGEVLGMVIGTALGWGNFATIALAVVLAFFFGYSLTTIPLLRSGLALAAVLPLAFASDTISITIMEIVDNLIMLVIPGAMEAGLTNL